MYHVSIGWSNMACEMDHAFLKDLNSEFESQLTSTEIKVQHVKLKIGNEIHTAPFS